MLTGRGLVGSTTPSRTSKSATTPRLWVAPSKSFAHNHSRCGRHLLLTAPCKHERNLFQIARLLRLPATAALDPWMRPNSTAYAQALYPPATRLRVRNSANQAQGPRSLGPVSSLLSPWFLLASCSLLGRCSCRVLCVVAQSDIFSPRWAYLPWCTTAATITVPTTAF